MAEDIAAPQTSLFQQPGFLPASAKLQGLCQAPRLASSCQRAEEVIVRFHMRRGKRSLAIKEVRRNFGVIGTVEPSPHGGGEAMASLLSRRRLVQGAPWLLLASAAS